MRREDGFDGLPLRDPGGDDEDGRVRLDRRSGLAGMTCVLCGRTQLEREWLTKGKRGAISAPAVPGRSVQARVSCRTVPPASSRQRGQSAMPAWLVRAVLSADFHAASRPGRCHPPQLIFYHVFAINPSEPLGVAPNDGYQRNGPLNGALSRTSNESGRQRTCPMNRGNTLWQQHPRPISRFGQ